MNFIIIGLIVLMGWITGQIMMFSGHIANGAVLIILSLAMGAAYFMKIRGNSGSKEEQPGKTMPVPVVLGTLAIALSMIGVAVVRNSPRLSLVLFIFSGALLLLAKPMDEKLLGFSGIPETAAPVQKWEPWFVLALFAVSAFIRLYDLRGTPPVGNGGEGLVLGISYGLAAKGAAYTPHIGGGTDWPTLTYYIGIIFAKIFGWDIVGFRVSSAALGIISIMAFYFLARRITSPLSAAIASAMYTVFIPHLAMSRLFVPLFHLLFITTVICLYFLLAANKNPKWYLFLAAGLACGFSLQSYVPGRGVFLLFTCWFVLMLMTRKQIFHNASNFFIFWGGFVLVSSPVIYFALRYPGQYWGYVQSVNPNQTGGAMAYLKTAIDSIPMYTEMLYSKNAFDVIHHYPFKQVFDPVVAVLFSIGFFMCVFSFWQPISSILLILFIGGMIPGMLGRGSILQPSTQRVLLTYPIIFLICAYAFERLRRVFYSYGGKLLYTVCVVAGITAALWSFQAGIVDYFINLAHSPRVLVNDSHNLYLMNERMRQHPDADMYLTPYYVGNDSFIIFNPPGKQMIVKEYTDEMFALNPGHDSLAFLGPFYINIAGLFKNCFPNSVTQIVREKKELMNDPSYTTMPAPEGVRIHTDEFVPFVYDVSVFIPKKDVVDFQTMLYISEGGKNDRVKVFGGSDFGEQYHGKMVGLKGAVIIPESGTYKNTGIPVVFANKWNGWSLKFDGRRKSFGRPIQADSGFHFFEISGMVPSGAKGDLPLSVTYDAKNLVDEGRVVAVDNAFGVNMFDTPGPNNWDKPCIYSRRLIGPNLRMYDGMSLSLPFSLKEEAVMRVPQDGEYTFTGNPKNHLRIMIDGVNVFENRIEDFSKFTSRPINLSKDRPVRLEAYMIVEPNPSTVRALTIYVKGPGMDKPELAPYDWFYPAE
jgi:4-amino-4-deoxy-L-arabinose transferase-like glycosyltransferase